MALHRLTSVTIGVPNADETAAYYTEFGLTPQHDGWFSTRDGGRQLRIVHWPMRRLVELRVGADDADDIARVADGLRRLGIGSARGPHSVTAVEKATRALEEKPKKAAPKASFGSNNQPRPRPTHSLL